MDIRIEIQNNDKVAANFARRAKEVPKALQRIISKVALTVERYGKMYSPVRTGLMRSTIYPVDINQSNAWVGPKVEYAPFVHRRVPFMFAARQDTVPLVPGLVKAEIKKALK